jgi:host factor-I protein
MGKQEAIPEFRLRALRFHPKPPKNKSRTHTAQQGKSPRPPEQTFQEAKYLKQLIEAGTEVRVKMTDGEEVVGTIEYYDQSFIRLTRDGLPNLFIFKHDIKYIQEET